ncbi:LysE family translocator [Echinicola strongylocentroti]|uniref:LysE family translocator n=1 Tax=Echinicola strongylocentroti TaxID=1795355 RepID=A0A2Z4IKK2_9BACT|nr:LysE family translocator [Echinicola strongylocentroti]AWW31652.1 LysE family translocator [Echinicola strongylocentroti]
MGGSLVEGIGMGLVLSLIIGPVFFALIQNSIEHGFRISMFMALGILLSDTVYVVISYFGVSFLTNNPAFKAGLGYVGGAIMIGFGLASFFKKGVSRPNSGGVSQKTPPRRRKGFLKGLSLNGVNPFVLLFWISIAGVVQLKKRYGPGDVFVFYVGMLLTVFSVDLLKVYIAKRLSKFITPRLMMHMNRAVGVILVVFGIRLLWYAVSKS